MKKSQKERLAKAFQLQTLSLALMYTVLAEVEAEKAARAAQVGEELGLDLSEPVIARLVEKVL